MPKIKIFILKDSIGYFSAVGEDQRNEQLGRAGVSQIFWSGGETIKQAIEKALKRAEKEDIDVHDLKLRLSA